jgi:hypothetical protein
MKKQYKATETSRNKWTRKENWKLEKSDIIGLIIFIAVIGFVLVRMIAGV